MDILKDTYKAPVEFDFKRNGYYYTDTTYFMPQVMLAERKLVSSGLFPLVK